MSSAKPDFKKVESSLQAVDRQLESIRKKTKANQLLKADELESFVADLTKLMVTTASVMSWE